MFTDSFVLIFSSQKKITPMKPIDAFLIQQGKKNVLLLNMKMLGWLDIGCTNGERSAMSVVRSKWGFLDCIFWEKNSIFCPLILHYWLHLEVKNLALWIIYFQFICFDGLLSTQNYLWYFHFYYFVVLRPTTIFYMTRHE